VSGVDGRSRTASGSKRIGWHFLALSALIGCLYLTPIMTKSADAREYAAIIVDAASGKVVHSRKADKQLYPASLTKIMTLYMVFDALEHGRVRLSTRIRVSKRASKQQPSKLYLKPGETITVRDAIFALVTKSANDVATAVAEHFGGTESEFAQQMTRKAWSLGMKRTRFRNASGLPDRRQKSTARDMSTLARAMLRDFGNYYEYFSTTSWKYRGKTYKNHNKLLSKYEGTDGIKTGYIRASGYNLVASVVRNGRRLIGVVFGGKTGASRDKQMMRILDGAFKKLPPVVVAGITPPRRKPQFVSLDSDDRTIFVDPAESGRNSRTVASLDLPASPRAAPREARANDLPEPPQANPRRVAAGRPVLAAGPISDASPAQGSRYADATRVVTAVAPVPAAVGTQAQPIEAWSIQVGAFSRYAPAHRAITSATRQIPSLLMSTKVAIIPVEKNQATLYRARMIGLSEAGARRACSELRRQNTPCMPVPPNDEALFILTQTHEHG